MNKVDIRFITLQDTSNIIKWRNQSYVRSKLYFSKPITKEQHEIYFHQNVETKKVIQFIIVVQSEEINDVIDIGTAFLKNIDEISKKAEFGIFIGEESALGKGFGTKAISKVLEYAFTELNLNRVWLQVFSDNIPAIKAYTKSGFKLEGRLVQDFLRFDGYADVSIMGITKDNWLRR